MTTFLDLPAELRNRIYFLALPCNLFYDLGAKEHDAENIPGQPEWAQGVPAICQTSQQLRNETIPIWRAVNNFQAIQRIPRDTSVPIRYSSWRVSINEILRPHLGGGFEHTRHFEWHVAGHEKIFPRSYMVILLDRRLELEDNHCKLFLEFAHDTFREGWCLYQGSRTLLEGKMLGMFLVVERLLGRRLTWEGSLRCAPCDRMFAM